MSREPVITASGVAALIVAVCTALGITVDDLVVQAIAGCAALLAPLLLGFLARSKVTPTAAPKANDGTPLRPDLDA